MGETTGIEWTDATWTPVRARYHMTYAADFSDGSPSISGEIDRVGWHCEHVSEGCRNCYAETMNKRLGTGLDYKPGNLASRGLAEMFLDEKLLLAPLKWRKPKRFFVCSMTDLFADFVPDAFIDRMFAVMALCPQHAFQVLTKRPERMREYFAELLASARWLLWPSPVGGKHMFDPLDQSGIWPLPNVWLGVSVEDQAAAAARIPLLLDTPAAVRFLSCEPLLGAVDIKWALGHPIFIAEGFLRCGVFAPGLETLRPLDWVIAGGESGPGARPMHPDWARRLRDQCAAAGVPFLFKQWGEWGQHGGGIGHIREGDAVGSVNGPVGENPKALRVITKIDCNVVAYDIIMRVGKKRAGRLLDGVQHDGMPA